MFGTAVLFGAAPPCGHRDQRSGHERDHKQNCLGAAHSQILFLSIPGKARKIHFFLPFARYWESSTPFTAKAVRACWRIHSAASG